MCGRFTLTLDGSALSSLFGFVEFPQWIPRFNIAPCQNILGIRNKIGPGNSVTEAVPLRWGLVPRWAKDTKGGAMMINARSETAREKPAFRPLVQSRRCLIPADGFYEWQRADGKALRPFLIRRQDRLPLGMAGLWETWIGPDGEEVETACILTTSSNGVMSAVHDRMPVLLEQAQFDLWLSPDERDTPEAAHMMRPAGEDVLDLVEIGPAVNKVANDGLWIQEPVDPSAPGVEPPAPKKERKVKIDPGQGELF